MPHMTKRGCYNRTIKGVFKRLTEWPDHLFYPDTQTGWIKFEDFLASEVLSYGHFQSDDFIDAIFHPFTNSVDIPVESQTNQTKHNQTKLTLNRP